ncbi:LysR family transcriptional regulator [Limimaricola pyoseonensis]|uniref:DNA-binding transcriptional regulator, LysR family n=1 Tax=Limimaricola pyoseonensis TaxID=521013 RepID=A0A1G7DH64_9RHOB|nr:LysR family transcriptional regulator [Limimaricola pyoseonensis]SDE50759.1 DNA-binding transcriptional regulator, LysR family [Limimaricola pyoseonensis]
MARNLDMTALRAFVTVAETGGVTRAAGLLNLTQSAVSMQLKRLEESLGLSLLDRSGRGVTLTRSGEQLLGYAQEMLALNDEALSRLSTHAYAGQITLGVPHDVVYPAIPQVLRRFAACWPQVKLQLVSEFTSVLKAQFARGELDVILTTEADLDPGGETLARRRLVWVGAPGGQAWRQRPLRLAHETGCIFRQAVQRRLDAAGIRWEDVVESSSSRTVEATVSADLAVHSMIEGTEPEIFERIAHGGALPDLGTVRINLYHSDPGKAELVQALVAEIRRAVAEIAAREAA